MSLPRTELKTRLYQPNIVLERNWAYSITPCIRSELQEYKPYFFAPLAVESSNRSWYVQPKTAEGEYFYTLPYTKETFVRSLATVYTYRTDLQCYHWGARFDGLYFVSANDYPMSDTDKAYMVADAKLKLAQEVKDRKALIGVTILEGRKTLDTLTNRVIQVMASYRAMRNGNMRKALRLLKSPKGAWRLDRSPSKKDAVTLTAENWMEWRYAITPVMLDAKGIAEQYCQTFETGRAPVFVAKASSQRTETERVSGVAWWGGALDGFSSPRLDYSGQAAHLTKYLVWAKCTISAPQYQTMVQWGLADASSTVWELTPLSWAADWFLDLGRYLDSITAYLGVDVLDAGEGWYKEDTVEATLFINQNPYLGYWSMSGNATSSEKRVRYTRQPLLEYQLQAQWPGLGATMNWKRYMDTCALARILFKGGSIKEYRGT